MFTEMPQITFILAHLFFLLLTFGVAFSFSITNPILLLVFAGASLFSAHQQDLNENESHEKPRTYRTYKMGFDIVPPRPDAKLVIKEK